MRKKFRTPQEKKRLSLERDSRAYGSNLKKPARRAAPQRKRLANRRRVEEGLRQIDAQDRFRAEELESKVRGREQAADRNRWRKWPSMRLREFIQLQKKRRALREERKKRSRLRWPSLGRGSRNQVEPVPLNWIEQSCGR